MKINQYVGLIAVNFLKGEFGIGGPNSERPAEFQAHFACFQATGLLCPQTESRIIEIKPSAYVLARSCIVWISIFILEVFIYI